MSALLRFPSNYKDALKKTRDYPFHCYINPKRVVVPWLWCILDSILFTEPTFDIYDQIQIKEFLHLRLNIWHTNQKVLLFNPVLHLCMTWATPTNDDDDDDACGRQNWMSAANAKEWRPENRRRRRFRRRRYFMNVRRDVEVMHAALRLSRRGRRHPKKCHLHLNWSMVS